ncbi:hypothetical protein [Kineococcus rubinsiae]|uniref:hypothetical protein n=1 Tax=Kineococcus rubinsiae TaxID=2609562 RepID=UPI001430376F|nr:hypothetical protein [Kineococcus rubinsiae]NIZ92261.1 hypothetical protein [Kineococcus rubinsiae]
MRKKIATALAIGAIGIGGLAVSGSASAADDATSGAPTSRIEAIKDALAGLVGDGSISQDQADEVATTLGSADLGPGGGHGPHGRAGGPDLATAATTLKLSEDDLRTALQGGKTLAQVAADQDVAVDDLVAALVDAEKARIATQVSDGDLTQAQADERLADLTQRVTDRVNSAGRPGGRGPAGDAPAAPAAPDAPAAPTAPSASPSATATSGT